MHDQIIPLIKKFMSIPSDVNDRDACLHILETAQKELEGFSFIPFANDGIPSLLYTNRMEPTKQCKIILNAHLDVIPSKKFEHWEKDGKLYGRGAYDMKAAAAVMLLVFKEIANKLPYTLGLQFTTDEETIGYNGVEYQLSKGVTAEFALSGECGSNLRIINQLRGLYVVKLVSHGKEAHAGHSWYGDNALVKLHHVINDLIQKYPTPHKPSWQTTINVANITTNNQTHNIVPAEATALLDIRFVPEDEGTILKHIEKMLSEGVTMELLKKMPAHDTKESNKYVQKLEHAIRQSGLIKPQIDKSYAGSDIIFFSMNAIDGVEFGPVGNGQHSANEWVDIKSLGDYYQILKNFLLSVK